LFEGAFPGKIFYALLCIITTFSDKPSSSIYGIVQKDTERIYTASPSRRLEK